MRRMTYFVMALALALGFTQCKKEQPTSQTEGVRITLTVDGGNSNSRVIVDPTGHTDPDYATVSFEDGDVIYVGYKVGESNKCVGTLTYSSSNSEFSGNVAIDQVVENEHLHFYFLGGVEFIPTVNAASTEATVVISDQSSKYPVISYSPSKEVFSTSTTSYSAVLKNKISIMKFNVDTPSTAAISITGMYNKVTVDFTSPSGDDNGFDYLIDGEGIITMPGVASSGASTWAIVLPQPAMGEGVAYTSDGYTGIRPAITTPITSNQYITSDFTMTVNTAHAIINGGGNTSGWTNDGGDPWGGSGGGDNNLGGWNNGGNNPWEN